MTDAIRSTASAPGSTGRDAALVAIGSATVAVFAFVLAPLGATVVYIVVASVVVGALAYACRDVLGPPLHAAAVRAVPRTGTARRRSRGALALSGTAALGLVAVASFLLAQAGVLAMAVVLGLLVLAVAGWICWPLLHKFAMVLPSDVAIGGPRSGRPRGASVVSRRFGLTAVVLATGAASFVLAGLGLKGLLAAVGLLVVVVLLTTVRNRSQFFTLLATVSLTFVLHKSLSSEDLAQSGGAISVYVTTFDALLLVLFGLWISEGTFVADVRAALRRRTLWAPLLGAVFLMPSLVAAPSPIHSGAELFRMFWMYLLFFYAAVRVRTRGHLWAVLAGLAMFVLIEFVVVVLQWQTGGVLGLSFLGVPTTLTQRVTDVSSLGRPFGTIIHPVFMGAVMGSLGLVALSLAIHLRRSLTKLIAAIMVLLCAIPLYLAHTRASAIAAVMAGCYVVAVGLSRRRMQWRTVGRFAMAAGVGVVALWPQLSTKFAENFGTGHFWEEIESRLQLNGIALRMFNDHWINGVGLNNFEVVEPKYESHYVIFFGNPVHNLYLLYLSETGVIGFLGFIAVAFAMFAAARRAARSSDRLIGGLNVGIVGAMIFLGLEELLGFSLRQDIPLAVYWLLAGLSVASLKIAGAAPPDEGDSAAPRPTSPSGAPRRDPSAISIRPSRSRPSVERRHRRLGAARTRAMEHTARHRRAPSRRRFRTPPRARLAAGLFGLVLVASGLSFAVHSGAAQATPVRIVFVAQIRASGQTAIFTSHTDGTDIVQLTPDDGRTYSWARWAFDNTKIVYTMRSGIAGSPESIWLMNSDGTGRRLIESFDYQVAQPTIDASGRWLVFTAAPPWFYRAGVFKMNLATLQSTNLTAVTSPKAGIDADPVLSPDQRHVVIISGGATQADVDMMSLDGTHRRTISSDGYFNTDPDISPDGSQIAVSSDRGPERPDRTALVPRTGDFKLVTRNIATGKERVLTKGINCATRDAGDLCSPADMSAYVPRYIDGGSSIAFDGAMDRRTTCICALSVDGQHPRVLVSSTALAIYWYDFQRPNGSSHLEGEIGAADTHAKLLITAAPSKGGPNRLFAASVDLMQRTPIPLPAGLSPTQARWSPDRSLIAFTAQVPLRRGENRPHPAPPPGQNRHEHLTLSDVYPSAVALAEASPLPRSLAREQVFVRYSDGTVKQLTDPWIEDWRDGLRSGDARANTDPVFTADGKSVVVTNTSTLDGESFLLRIDLASGRVMNLTNATSGLLPASDTSAAVSPNGKLIAFATTIGSYSDIYTMNAANGRDVREITDTAAPNSAPTWAADGHNLVSVTTSHGVQELVRTGLSGQRTTILTHSGVAPVDGPVADPDGSVRVLFIGSGANGRTLYRTALTGAAAPTAVQPDPLNQILFVDWR